MSRRNHEQIQDSSDEAEEVEEHVELEAASEHSSEEEGEDLLEDAERDYQRIEALDQYQAEGIDDEEYEINPEARKAAQKELLWKERQEDRQDQDVEFYMEDIEEKQAKRKRAEYYGAALQDYNQDDDQQCIDAEEQKGKFDGWVNLEAVRKYIRHHMCKFFTRFSLNKNLIYYPLIKQMVLQNKQSLKMDYQHLRSANAKLAYWLAYHPISFIPQLNAALYSITCSIYPNYKFQQTQCFVRVFNLPVVDKIRNLSYSNLGQLIRFYGVVTARSEVYNQLFKIIYKCYVCGVTKGPYYINRNGLKPTLGRCQSCQSPGPFMLQKAKSIYRNYQKLTIQQSPSHVEPGRIPRSKEVIVYADVVDTVKPGAQVDIIGVFSTRYQCSLNVKQGFPVFNTFIEVNSITQVDQISSFAKIDEQAFIQFSRRPNFEREIFKSIAPSVYGHFRVKKALTMAMFGGVAKNRQGHKTRGDINVLLLGDPGVAKSQFLKSVQKVFYRCIYTTGKGASAVGLTASVKQDAQSGQWRLEAGALVMADKGICLIDEFDKMSEADRTSIHEAMQQQTISISKAGIVANLNARCSVIAAANPYGGCYNQTLNFADNVELTPPIISRFDILNVIKDKHNKDLDSSLSEFVINVHMQNHPYSNLYLQHTQKENDKSSQSTERESTDVQLDFLKQYIKYARERYSPTLSSSSAKKINNFYVDLRKYSTQCGGINIAPRHLESMIRICQAHAKMHLRSQTQLIDADFAVDMMLQSFIDTQKYSTAQLVLKKFEKYLLKEVC